MPSAIFRCRFVEGATTGAPAAPTIASITPDSPELRALVLGQVAQIFKTLPAVVRVVGTVTAEALAPGLKPVQLCAFMVNREPGAGPGGASAGGCGWPLTLP